MFLIGVLLTAGQCHESPLLPRLIQIWLDRFGGQAPRTLSGDKGYSSTANRKRLNELGVQDVIPTRKDEPADPDFDKDKYRKRHQVENWNRNIKGYRAIATRYDKLDGMYRAAITVGAIQLELRRLANPNIRRRARRRYTSVSSADQRL